MAAKTIVQRIAMDGGEEIRRQLESIGKAGESAFGRVSSSVKVAADAGINLNTTADKVSSALTGLQSDAQKLGSNFSDLGKALADVGRGLVSVAKLGAAAGAALLAVSKSGASAADEQRKQSQAVGLSIEEYGRLKFALSQSGVEAGQMNRVFAALNDQLESSGPNKAKDALNALGVSLTRTADGSVDTVKVLNDVADKFAQLPDGAKKSSAAIDLFGKRVGQQMIPLLNSGSRGIKELGDQAERLGLVFTKDQGVVGEEMHDAFERLTGSVAALKNQFGLLFAKDFVRLFDVLTNIVADNREAILDVAKAIRAALVPAFEAIGAVALPVFRTVKFALDEVAKGVNTIFGTTLTGQQLAIGAGFIAIAGGVVKLGIAIAGLVPGFGRFAGLLIGLPGALSLITGSFKALFAIFGSIAPAVRILLAAFGGVPLAIGLIVAAVAVFIATNENARKAIANFAQSVVNAWNGVKESVTSAANGLWTAITNGAKAVGDFFAGLWKSISDGAQAAWDSIVEGVTGFVDSIVQFFTDLGGSIVKAFNDAVESVKGVFTSMLDFAKEKLGGVIDFLSKIIEVAKEAAKALLQTGGAGGGGTNSAPQFARGGAVRGPGTGTSDSILAWVSNGEFVNTARAVRYYGRELFERLNRLQLPKAAFPQFRMGGLVEALGPAFAIPRFAGGGLATAAASGGRPLTLVFDGQSINGLTAGENAVRALMKLASNKALTKAGHKPGWY